MRSLILTGLAAGLLLALPGAGPVEPGKPVPQDTAPKVPLPLSAEKARALDPHGTAPVDDALTCLARTIYFEARGDGRTSMEAVAHVVRNRVADKDFPRKVCAVIKEGGKAHPCQFSWWCNGRPDVAENEKAYAEAREIAREVLNGQGSDPTHGANAFVRAGTRPSWTRKAKRTARIGHHVFYRVGS